MNLSQETGSFVPDNLVIEGTMKTAQVVIASGQNVLPRGAVLGKKLAVLPASGTLAGTGNGTLATLKARRHIKAGTYTVTASGLTTITSQTGAGIINFNVTDPDGLSIGFVSVPLATSAIARFDSDQISFVITNGATDFDDTSVFTIAVTKGVPATGAIVGTGNGTVVQVAPRKNLKKGNYVATCTAEVAHGGVFDVVNPDGDSVGTLYVSKYAGTGNGTVTQVKAGPDFKKSGPYLVKCTDVTGSNITFTVYDPDGTAIGTCVVTDGTSDTVVFWHKQISLKITNGSTDFVANDLFTVYLFESQEISMLVWDGSSDVDAGDTITIAASISANECKLVNIESADGSDLPFAVLSEEVDATSVDVTSTGYITGEFNENKLYFGANDDIETFRALMREVGLFTRSAMAFPDYEQ